MGVPKLYWLNRLSEGHLAIMAAPRPENSLDDVLLAWKGEGVDIVVCMVEAPEMPGLIEAERDVCGEVGLEFIWFPVRDKTVPLSGDAVSALAKRLSYELLNGRSVAIHCRAGIGRSTLLAACVLIHLHIDAAVALDIIAEARGLEVPETEAQRQWILKFGEAAPSRMARSR